MKSYIRLFVCLFMLGFGEFPLHAQTRSIISNLANPAIGLSALFLGQAAPDLSQPYGLQFQEAELTVLSTVDPDWILTANLVFTAQSAVAEEAFVTTDRIPGVQMKLGQSRASFGKYGLLHTHAFPFIQAPFVMDNTVGHEGFKDMGLEAAWLTPLPWYCELTLGGYQAVASTGDHPLNFNSSSHDNIPYLGRLKNQFDLDEDTTMELGTSALTGMGDDGLHHAVYGADLTFRNVPLRQSNQRGWILQVEYLKKVSFTNKLYNQESDGWYESLQLRLSQQWWTGFRVEEAFHSNPSLLDPINGILSGHVQRASANVSLLSSDFSEIRAEYSVAKAVLDDGSGAQWDHRVMLQFNYIIGFHPPHAY